MTITTDLSRAPAPVATDLPAPASVATGLAAPVPASGPEGWPAPPAVPGRYADLVPRPAPGCPDRILPADVSGIPDGYTRYHVRIAEDALRTAWHAAGKPAGMGAADPDAGPIMAEKLIEAWRRWWRDPYREHDPCALAVLRDHLTRDPAGRLILHGTRRYPAPLAEPARPLVLAAWMDGRTTRDGKTRTRVLHEDYRAWCEARGWMPAEETPFGVMLTGLGLPSRKIGGNMVRQLALRPEVAGVARGST